MGQKYGEYESVAEAHATVVFQTETSVVKHEVSSLVELNVGIEQPKVVDLSEGQGSDLLIHDVIVF